MTTVADSPAIKTKPRRLGTAQDVGERLSAPVSTVYELARTHRIPGVVRIGRSVRFDLEKVEMWIAQGGEAELEAQ